MYVFFCTSRYVIFTAIGYFTADWPILFGAVACGMGAALLWTSQGSYLAEQTSIEVRGRGSGIFQAIFRSSTLIGNLLASILISMESNIAIELVYSLFWFHTIDSFKN